MCPKLQRANLITNLIKVPPGFLSFSFKLSLVTYNQQHEKRWELYSYRTDFFRDIIVTESIFEREEEFVLVFDHLVTLTAGDIKSPALWAG